MAAWDAMEHVWRQRLDVPMAQLVASTRALHAMRERNGELAGSIGVFRRDLDTLHAKINTTQ